VLLLQGRAISSSSIDSEGVTEKKQAFWTSHMKKNKTTLDQLSASFDQISLKYKPFVLLSIGKVVEVLLC
jgi:hypothetical protein